jgi:hypothetical protein
VHGCLLRIERPSESKSYLVDARFSKRVDAKAAVCLQAMSEGVGSYIRAIGEAVGNRVTPSMRKRANEVLPIIVSEYNRVCLGRYPVFQFEKEKDGKPAQPPDCQCVYDADGVCPLSLRMHHEVGAFAESHSRRDESVHHSD